MEKCFIAKVERQKKQTEKGICNTYNRQRININNAQRMPKNKSE